MIDLVDMYGLAAYDAYCDAVGVAMPAWAAVPRADRECWAAAGMAAVREHLAHEDSIVCSEAIDGFAEGAD